MAAYPADVVTLIVSDIPGDCPQTVASGPTLPDPMTNEEVLGLLQRYRGALPSVIWRAVGDPCTETLKAFDPAAPKTAPRVLVRARDALDAAGRAARQAGFDVSDLGDAIEGEAREVAGFHAALVRERLGQGAGPLVILSGGETTVTVRGEGRGGRNTEYLLALALGLEGVSGVAGLAADTDGIDGAGPHAGAWFDGATLQKARAAGLDPSAALDANDSATVFAAAGAELRTGPTRTNVNDFRALVIRP